MPDLVDAEEVAAKLLELLRPWTTRAVIAGSIRRHCPEVKDIEIVCEPSMVTDGMFGDERLAVAEIQELVSHWGPTPKLGRKYIQVLDVLGSGIVLDLFLVTPPASWGALLAIRTGPAAFSQMLVTRIKGRLWSCTEGHVIDHLGRDVPTPTEQDFFDAAQVQWLEPEERA